MKHTDFNNLWYPILNELKRLEQEGIAIEHRQNLKGTLTQLAMDNLGANSALGFNKCFRQDYCRHCECTYKECSSLTTEKSESLRTIESYQNQLKTIAESSKVNLSETHGVKYYCILSDLEYFHILTHPTVDIMHDVNEGAVPFVLKLFFNKCFESKVISAAKLSQIIQQFNFGWLDRQNFPSDIAIDRRSLGQNASQSLCLIRNVPFILYQHRDEPLLRNMWKCIQALLRVIEIVYSHEIIEADLTDLEQNVSSLLSEIVQCGRNLIPKLHFMTHYATIVRKMGPIVYMSMMRYERKHNVLKDFIRASRNFVDINKTMAIKHQQQLCTNGYDFKNDIEHGVSTALDEPFLVAYRELLQISFGPELNAVKQAKWLSINNFEYRAGLLIVHESNFHQIKNILIHEAEYFFLCQSFAIRSVDKFLNSYHVRECIENVIIAFHDLNYLKSYELLMLSGNKYVKVDTLELRNHINKTI